jgi:hypothetical protein
MAPSRPDAGRYRRALALGALADAGDRRAPALAREHGADVAPEVRERAAGIVAAVAKGSVSRHSHGRSLRFTAITAAALVVVGCSRPSTSNPRSVGGSLDDAQRDPRPADAQVPVATEEAGTPSPHRQSSPLDGERTQTLAVPGFGDAVVLVPIGSTTPRGLVVALHGNFDRPEWACESWRHVAGPGPFVLCLRVVLRSDSPPGDPRYSYAGAPAAERELAAAVAAFKARFGPHLADQPPVYAGFSLGAIVGISIAPTQSVGRVALVEGGQTGWTDAAAKRFRQRGGERVLFVCSQPGCLADSNRAASTLRRAGAEATVVDGGNHGHRYDGPIADATQTRWAWLVSGLAGFEVE